MTDPMIRYVCSDCGRPLRLIPEGEVLWCDFCERRKAAGDKYRAVLKSWLDWLVKVSPGADA